MVPLKPLEWPQLEKQLVGRKPQVLFNSCPGNFCRQLLTGDYTCLYGRNQSGKKKYGSCRYTGLFVPGQFPSFCSSGKNIVINSPHANRVLVIDYRHTETYFSGTYLPHILVNLKSASKEKHHQKFVGGILVLSKNALAHNPKLVHASSEQCEL